MSKILKCNQRVLYSAIAAIVLVMLVLLAGGCQSTVTTAPSAQSSSVMPSLANIVNRVLPTVVYISDTVNDPVNGPGQAAGSGVILRSDGYILTNKHVVDGATDVQVTTSDGTIFDVPASSIWMDDMADLAVLKIDAKDLPTATFGDPANITVGDWVLAIGNALGLSPVEGGPTVTDGIVSNLNRSLTVDSTQYYDLIQTSAAINSGNSGGPLINMQGQVIGINSVGSTQAQNIGFAINVGTAQHIYNDLVQYGRPDHPYLGAVPGDISQDIIKQNPGAPKLGALITDIDAKSPAELAGMQRNDIILKMDSDGVKSAADLVKAIWRHQAGDKVQVIIWRNGSQKTIDVTLGQRQNAGAV